MGVVTHQNTRAGPIRMAWGSQCDLLAFRGDASALDRADSSRGTPPKKNVLVTTVGDQWSS